MSVLRLRKIVLNNFTWKNFSSLNLKEVSSKNDVYQCVMPKPELDIDYLCNLKNKEEIENNIKRRKGVGNIQRVQELYNALNTLSADHERNNLEREFMHEANSIPNKSHPSILNYGEDPKVMKEINIKKDFSFQAEEFSKIAKRLNLIRTENLGHFCGQRSYFLLGDLAEMEQALVNYAVQNLLQRNFKLISVPDILPRQIIEACGMNTRGTRTQVYELDPELHPPDMILSGTSEMALAGYLMNRTFASHELPQKLAAVSRCYRAEISSMNEEKGIYRVHQFTKVEMFGVTDEENSERLLEEFLSIEEQSFNSLGLHFKILDMPPQELGSPAYRKYDVEAWLPGRNVYGEVSSCSNCTDYQSRRLNMKYQTPQGKTPLYVHTVNGTACAVPRTLIALLETHQRSDGTVDIPDALQPYMRGKKLIEKQSDIPNFKYIRSTSLQAR